MCGVGLVFGPNISRMRRLQHPTRHRAVLQRTQDVAQRSSRQQLLRGPGRVGLDEHPAVEPGDRVDTQRTVRVLAKLVARQQFLTHRVAEVVGQDMRVSDTQVMQQRLVHVGVIVHRILVGNRLRREAHAHHVRSDDGEPLRQRRPNRFPIKGIERIAVDQQQRRPAALDPVEDVEAEVVEIQPGVQPRCQPRVHDAAGLRDVANDALGDTRRFVAALDLDGGRHGRLGGAVAQVLDVDQRALRANPRADRDRRRGSEPC